MYGWVLLREWVERVELLGKTRFWYKQEKRKVNAVNKCLIVTLDHCRISKVAHIWGRQTAGLVKEQISAYMPFMSLVCCVYGHDPETTLLANWQMRPEFQNDWIHYNYFLIKIKVCIVL